MKSSVVKRSVVIAGHKTSVTLEDAFWNDLRNIATGRDMTLSDLVSEIDSKRQYGNLSSAIRLFVLDFHRNQISEPEKRSRMRKQRHRPDGSKGKMASIRQMALLVGRCRHGCILDRNYCGSR
jgi:predicted DNA-binding ribbon-helix-helix protein